MAQAAVDELFDGTQYADNMAAALFTVWQNPQLKSLPLCIPLQPSARQQIIRVCRFARE